MRIFNTDITKALAATGVAMALNIVGVGVLAGIAVALQAVV
jgi:hypothetical protein